MELKKTKQAKILVRRIVPGSVFGTELKINETQYEVRTLTEIELSVKKEDVSKTN